MPSVAPEGWHSVTTRLMAHDAAGLVRFIKETFAATGDYAEKTPATLRIGDSIVMVSAAGPRKPTSSCLYVYVEDADTTYQRALAAGATPMEEPADTPWGDRRAIVSDPFGNDWQIATHAKPNDSA